MAVVTREKLFAYWIARIAAAGAARITQGEAVRFLFDMNCLGLLYHPDDNPADIVCGDRGVFTENEAVALSDIIMPAMREADLVHFTCLSDICLRLDGVSGNPVETPFICPAWNFTLQDDCDSHYAGWLLPDNREWVRVLLDKKEALRALAADASFRVVEEDGGAIRVIESGDEDESDLLPVTRIMTTIGEKDVYDMTPLFWCWVAADCAENNAAVWRGYAPHLGCE